MSVLNYLFKDRDQKRPGVAPSPESKTTEVVSTPATETRSGGEPTAAPPNFEEIRNALEQIAEVLGRGDGYEMLKVTSANVTAMDLPLREVMKLCPAAFCIHQPAPQDERKKVTVLVEDLFAQLSRGNITTSVKHLVSDVPMEYLSQHLEQMLPQMVNLPLPTVVGNISPEELRKRTTNRQRALGIDQMPNLFTPVSVRPPAAEPESEAMDASIPDMEGSPVVAGPEKPDAEPALSSDEILADTTESVAGGEIPEPEAPPASSSDEAFSTASSLDVVEALDMPADATVDVILPGDASAPQTVVLPGSAAARPVAEPGSDRVAASREPLEAPGEMPEVMAGTHSGLLLRGIDLNSASVQELVNRLDGVGLRLAERMVRDRQERGIFMDILDLARVPGLGRRTFEKITGLPWPEGEEVLPEILNQVLAVPANGHLSVRDVTGRFGQLPGFEGCLIAHQEGYVLASGWTHPSNEALGAFAPQIFKKVARYIHQLRLGRMSSATIMLEHRPFTFIQSHDIYFVAVHKEGGLSMRQIRLAQAVGSRLGRLLRSRRWVA